MLQRKYQEKVNQCVAECLEQDKRVQPTDIQSVIAQTLGMNIDKTSSGCVHAHTHVCVFF